MARAISYFIFSSNGSYLRWDDDTTIDFLIRQYQMSITGGGGVDRLYAGAGTKVDAGALFASANTDELYLSGNFNDYTQTISAGGVYTFTGLAGGSRANEVVSFSMNSNGDKLVFANGHVTVKSSDYLSVAGSYSSILAGSLTPATQTDPASGAQPGNKPAKVFVFDAGGINIPQLPIAGEALVVSGGGGVDKFYVRKGTNADAIGLFASAGQDVLYLTGRFADYTQTKSAGGVYTFTRNFTNADASLTEVVNFSMNSSGDQLVFADGGVTLRLADYLTGGTYANITAGQLSPGITTPGLLPSLRLLSDTGFSASDRLTSNPTILVSAIGSGATWSYQVDGGSWMAGGTGISFTATSGIHTYNVQRIDAAITSVAISTVVYTVDMTAPATPTLRLASDTGRGNSDNLTNNATINVTGLESGATWQFSIDGGSWTSAVASNNAASFTALSGTHSYVVQQIDNAGNTSSPSAAMIYSLVTTLPTVTLEGANRNVSQDARYGLNLSGGPAGATGPHASLPSISLGGDLTIEMWVNVRNFVEWGRLADINNGQSNNNIVFGVSPLGNLRFDAYNQGASISPSGVQIQTTSTLTANEWAHVAVTVNASNQVNFFINGQLAATNVNTTLTATLATVTRTNTWLGKSAWPDAYLNAQIRDYRIYDSARTATQIASDMAGNIDTQDSNLRLAYGFTTNANSALSGQASASLNQATVSATALAATATLSAGASIGSVNITATGLRDGVNEKLLVGSSTIALDGSVSSGTVSVGADTWSWVYAASSFTFSLTNATVTQCQNFIRALNYSNLAASPTMGSRQFSITVQDAAGNSSLVAMSTVNDSFIAPTLSLASDTANPTDNITINPTINVTGLKSGAVWFYQIDGGNLTPGIGNSFTMTMGGNHSYSVLQIDSSGRPVSSTPTIYNFWAPPSLRLLSDTGFSASDNVTNNATINVLGLQAGATWAYKVDVDALGNWITGTASSFIASSGAHTYFVRQSDALGSLISTINTAVYTLDISAPTIPTLMLASDTGSNTSDNVTNNATILVSGLETATGSRWAFQVDSTGSWTTGTGSSFTASSGNHTYLVRQADAAGNSSVTSTATIFVLDTSAPSITGSTTGSVAENTLGAVMLTANANDATIGTTVTWSIATGNDASRFNISNTGVLSFKEAPNFERPRNLAPSISNTNAYTVSVIATDVAGNASVPVPIVINVTDVNEAPILSAQTPNQTVSHQVSFNISSAFSDPDSVNSYSAGTPQWGTLTYTATGLPAGFNISSAGVISGTGTVTASPVTVTVTAVDGGGQSVTETFTLSVVNNLVLSHFTVSDGVGNARFGKSGGTLSFTVGMSEAVTVTGTPTITFDINGQVVTASYLSGSGSNTLIFTGIAPTGNGNNISVSVINLAGAQVQVRSMADSTLLLSSAIVGQAYTGYTIDNIAPITPTLTLLRDTGSSASDAVTNNATINVTGLESGATWQFSIDGGSWTSAVTSNNAASFTALSGTHSYVVQQIDNAGNTSSPSAAMIYNLVTIPPTLTLDGANRNVSQDARYGLNLPGGLAGATGPHASLPSISLGGDLTIEMWINVPNFVAWGRLADIGNGQQDNNVIFGLSSSGHLRFDAYNQGASISPSGVLIQTTSTVTANEWAHVAVTVNASNQVNFFINGQLAATTVNTTLTATLATVTRTNTWLGKSAWPDPYLNAKIRDYRIYDSARTASQIASDMVGNIDTQDSDLRLAYGFTTNANSALSGQASASLNQATVSATALAATATLSAGASISSVNIIATGLRDGVNEKLLVGSSIIALDGSVISGTVSVGADVWSWVYADSKFTFSLTNATATQCQNFIRALNYNNLASSPTMGSRQFSITVQDAAGNSSLAAMSTVNDSLIAPTLSLASDTANPTDNITINPTINVSGLESGAVWFYQVDASGSWNKGMGSSFSMMAGNHSYNVLEVDSGGRLASNVTITANFLTPPSLRLVSDTGFSASDNLTNNATINVLGLQSGATWIYKVDVEALGDWITGTASSFTASSGVHTYFVRQIDATLANASASLATIYTLDTSLPATPILMLASDTGMNASDNLTSNITINVGGLESDARWEYQVDGGTWVNGAGTNFTGLLGLHSYVARQTDKAGNPSSISTGVSYNIFAFAAPSITLASDTGSSDRDGVTSNASVNVLGLLSGTTWAFQVDGTAGNWIAGTGSSFIASEGVHSYFVRQSDNVGNTSSPGAAIIYNLATILPAVNLDGANRNISQDARYGLNLPGGDPSPTGPHASLPSISLGVDLTIEMWINGRNFLEWQRLTDIGNGQQNNNIVFGLSPAGHLRFDAYNQGDRISPSGVLIQTTSTLTANEWAHVAVTVNASNQVNFFINGQLAATSVNTTLTAPIATVMRTNTWLGKGAWSGDPYLNAQIRDYRIYDSARTASQIASDMAGNIDTQDSNLRLAYAFTTNANSALSGQASASLVSQATLSLTALAATATLSAGASISSINITATGLRDGVNEKLLVGSSTIALDGSVSSGTVSVGADTWSWVYANSSFTFSLANATATQSQNFIRTLNYSNLATTHTMGSRQFSITVQDAAGNSSLVAMSTVNDSLIAPTLSLASDTANPTDNITINPTINVTGLESGAVWFYQVDATGGWNKGMGSSFSMMAGNHSYSVLEVDSGGRSVSSSMTTTYNFWAPPSLRLLSDTGSSASDNVTNNATISVLGLQSGATWVYQVDGTAGTSILGSGSSFTATNGLHTYFVRQTDATAINTSMFSTAVTYTLDTSPPVAPTLRLASDDGGSASDGITSNPTILVSGLETAVGTTWAFQVDSTVGGWTTGSSSTFIASSGPHTYFVRQTDVAGNVSGSNMTTYTLNASPSMAPALSLTDDTSSGSSISITNDINSDGYTDWLIGAPNDAGKAFVLFGSVTGYSNSAGVLVQGSGRVMGTLVNEVLVGSAGEDILTGGGGVDLFFAGAGNDIIVLTASDLSNLNNIAHSVRVTVNGGTGIDVIQLTGGADLDFSAGFNTASHIASIERIDLATDKAANILTLSEGDVLSITGMNSFNISNGWTNTVGNALSASVQKHQLVIDGLGTGTEPDVVKIKNFTTAWTQSQTGGRNDIVTYLIDGVIHTYHIYNSTSDNAQLLIDTSILPILG